MEPEAPTVCDLTDALERVIEKLACVDQQRTLTPDEITLMESLQDEAVLVEVEASLAGRRKAPPAHA